MSSLQRRPFRLLQSRSTPSPASAVVAAAVQLEAPAIQAGVAAIQVAAVAVARGGEAIFHRTVLVRRGRRELATVAAIRMRRTCTATVAGLGITAAAMTHAFISIIHSSVDAFRASSDAAITL